MATLLGGLAFAAFILAQVAAVAAIHAERKSHRPEAFDAARSDHPTRLIRNSGC